MRTTAPSMTRLALSTSIPKSAWPGVSIRLKVQSFHLTGMLADCTVIPRSRSTGRKSVVVLPVSTVPDAARYDDLSRIDSVRVVLPESAEEVRAPNATGMITNQCVRQGPCCAAPRHGSSSSYGAQIYAPRCVGASIQQIAWSGAKSEMTKNGKTIGLIVSLSFQDWALLVSS